jgi:hypothetical protein
MINVINPAGGARRTWRRILPARCDPRGNLDSGKSRRVAANEFQDASSLKNFEASIDTNPVHRQPFSIMAVCHCSHKSSTSSRERQACERERRDRVG